MFQRLFLIQGIALMLLCGTVNAGQKSTPLRFGYLDDPGSALVVLADAKGYFKREHLQVILVKYINATDGLSALDAGTIQAGAFSAKDILHAIAQDKELKIIAGGGAPKGGGLLAELGQNVQIEPQLSEILTVVRNNPSSQSKEVSIHFVSALIHAYQTLQRNENQSLKIIRKSLKLPASSDAFIFDPNPDFYRFEALWKELGLQHPDMRRDHLASHVYEEIYCDALDQALDNHPNDPILQKLFSKAVCTPDCCPVKKDKK